MLTARKSAFKLFFSMFDKIPVRDSKRGLQTILEAYRGISGFLFPRQLMAKINFSHRFITANHLSLLNC